MATEAGAELILGRERDAWFVIRGYGYQVDLTILRWLNLKSDESLELECGEDIDLLSRSLLDGVCEEVRLLEQIKSCAKTVTLTSAREAIANFVEHRDANKINLKLSLRFRFTTSATVATEKPCITTDGKAGIVLWREIATGEVSGAELVTALTSLRAALGKFTRPTSLNTKPGRKTWRGFKNFLKKATDPQLLAFIRAFEWSTGNTSPDAQGEEVQRVLIERALTPDTAEAKVCYEQLFVHVFKLLCGSGRKRLEHDELATVLSRKLTTGDRDILNRVVSRLSDLEARLSATEARVEDHAELLEEHAGRIQRQEGILSILLKATASLRHRLFAELRADREADSVRHAEMRAELSSMRGENIKNSPEALEMSLELRIDDARAQAGEGKGKTARAVLERLRPEVSRLEGRPSHDRLLASIVSLLGFCAWMSGDTEVSSVSFRQAQRLQPTDPKYLANAAYAALSEGDPTEALRLSKQAQAVMPLHAGAAAVAIRALHELGRGVEASKFLEEHPDLAREPEVLVTLGSLAWQRQEFSAAQEHAQAACRQEPANANAWRLLSDAMVASVHKTIQGDGPLDPDEAGQAILRQAEDAQGRAIELMAAWEERATLLEALARRAAIRELLNNVEGTLADCDRVLAEKPDSDVALLIKGETLLRHCDQPLQAASLLERVRDGALQPWAALLRAQAHAQKEQWSKVVAALEPHYHPSLEDRGQIDFAQLLLEALFHLGEHEQVHQIKRDLAAIYPGDAVALAMRAEQEDREGNEADAVRLWEEALDLAQGDRRRRMAFYVAELHSRCDNSKRAAALFKIVIEGMTSAQKANYIGRAMLWRYTRALFESHQHDEALHVVREMRADGRALRGFSEIEAAIEEEHGNLKVARMLLLQLSEDAEASVEERAEHALQAGVLAAREGDNESLRAALANIPFEAIEDHAHNLMQVALWRGELGLPDALPYAYRAHRMGFNDEEIHHRYFWFWRNYIQDDDPLYNVRIVAHECGVKLRWHGGTTEYLITRVLTGDSRGITPDDPHAVRLLGRAVGDVVTLNDDLDGTQHEIIEVKSKYLHALHETFEKFASGQLQHPQLVVKHINAAQVQQPFNLRQWVQSNRKAGPRVNTPRLKDTPDDKEPGTGSS